MVLFKALIRFLVLKLATLVPPLEITALHTEHVPILLMVLSSIKYCPTADMLLSLSDSREINFLFATLKTVVARIDFRCVTLSRANRANLEVSRSRF